MTAVGVGGQLHGSGGGIEQKERENSRTCTTAWRLPWGVGGGRGGGKYRGVDSDGQRPDLGCEHTIQCTDEM